MDERPEGYAAAPGRQSLFTDALWDGRWLATEDGGSREYIILAGEPIHWLAWMRCRMWGRVFPGKKRSNQGKYRLSIGATMIAHMAAISAVLRAIHGLFSTTSWQYTSPAVAANRPIKELVARGWLWAIQR
jgi:hypothetical protein